MVASGVFEAAPVIDRLFEERFRVPERLDVDVWAERYRVITSGSRPGLWSNDTAPYAIEPMRLFGRGVARRIVLMFGTQSAKTSIMECCEGWWADQDPFGDLILVMDTINNANTYVKSRLREMFESTPRLAAKISQDRDEYTLNYMRFGDGKMYVAGANSAGNLAQKSAKRALGDELDKWPVEMKGKGGKEGAAVRLLENRTDGFPDHVILLASSPSEEGLGISEQFEKSDRAKFHVPCPHCGTYQELQFSAGRITRDGDTDGESGRGGGVRWEGGLGMDITGVERNEFVAKVRRDAWYECSACGGRIENAHKPKMLRSGVWVRPGQRAVLDPDAPKGGGPWGTWPAGVRVEGPLPDTVVRGFQISQLYSPFRSFGDIAHEFVEWGGVPDRVWFNTRLGEPYRPKGARRESEEIIDLARQTPAGHTPYKLREVPKPASPGDRGSGPEILIGAIDVQADHVYYVVRGYGSMRRSWLIDYGRVACPETVIDRVEYNHDGVVTADLGQVRLDDADVEAREQAELEALLIDNWSMVRERLIGHVYPWPVPSSDGTGSGGGREVDWWCIDAQYRTSEVYRFARAHADKVLCTRGDKKMSVPHRLVSGEDAAASRGGQPSGRRKGGGGAAVSRQDLEVLNLDAHFWKEHVFSSIDRRPPAAGAWHWPGDLGMEYADQITAEELVVKQTRHGFERVFEPRPGRKDNHLLDCEVHGAALADHLGVSDWGLV